MYLYKRDQQATMQTVFKIDVPKRAGLEQEKPFIPRRVHFKSRGGCLACKKMRIKVRYDLSNTITDSVLIVSASAMS